MANLNLHPHDGEREGACLDLAGDRKEERVRTQPAAAILCDSAGREDPATSSLAASPPYPGADLMDGRSGRGCGTAATELGMGHGDGGAVANGNPWVRDARHRKRRGSGERRDVGVWRLEAVLVQFWWVAGCSLGNRDRERRGVRWRGKAEGRGGGRGQTKESSTADENGS